MSTFLSIVLIILIHSSPVSNGYRHRLYIWDVGQGQWITWVDDTRCTHFDMGGEKAPLNKIKFLCGRKQNSIYMTHSDLDHIKYLRWGFQHLNNLCLHTTPREKLHKSKFWLLNLRKCVPPSISRVSEIQFDTVNFSEPNDLSRVFLIHTRSQNVVIPGDSTIEAERRWTQNLALNESSRPFWIVLGHHGSKTSTEAETLATLKKLTHGFCSARKKRYGHPHPKVTERVRRHGTPLVCTEPWGHIQLEL